MYKTNGQLVLKRMGITQRHVSRMLNINNVRLTNIFKGREEPTVDELEALCDYFNLSEEEIFEPRRF